MSYPYTQFYQDPIFVDNNTVKFESAGWICLIDVAQRKEISKTEKAEPSYYPIYSLDRKKVAFQNFVGKYHEKGGAVYEVFIADSNGGNRKQITHNGACNRPKVFSPDGAQVVFLSGNPFDRGNLALWQVDVSGENPRRLK